MEKALFLWKYRAICVENAEGYWGNVTSLPSILYKVLILIRTNADVDAN